MKTEIKTFLTKYMTGPYLCRMLGRQQKPETGLSSLTQ